MNKHSVSLGNGGWWGRLQSKHYFMNRGPYRWQWMALLSFPIQRWTWRRHD